jgi:phosphoribosylformimino-5-aminoimidazole carboxamide ribotide isomerase
MLIIPAIDIRGGQAVRLLQGDDARAIAYAGHPVAWAERWVTLGARWLHVVDLDGAFAGRRADVDLLRAICSCGVPVQTGGGFRTPEDIEEALAVGAARVIVGTAAADLAGELGRFGERVAVSLDVRDGKVALRGWTEQTGVDAVELAADLRSKGIRRFIYTDISRDGMLTGPNVAALRSFVQAAGAPVMAAGGIASTDDLVALSGTGVEGAIVGRALYEGRIDLASVVDRIAPRC